MKYYYIWNIWIYFAEKVSWQSGYAVLDLMGMNIFFSVHHKIFVPPRVSLKCIENTFVYHICKSLFLPVFGIVTKQSSD